MNTMQATAKLMGAVDELKKLQDDAGRGPGGRELALAVTNAEQSFLWLREAFHQATRAEEEARPRGPVVAGSIASEEGRTQKAMLRLWTECTKDYDETKPAEVYKVAGMRDTLLLLSGALGIDLKLPGAGSK
jgi:hypothetical protein